MMAEEDIEYESDPEEAKLSLKMRRREASDDEDAEEEDTPGEIREKQTRRIGDSDVESEGAAPEYEDELGEEEDYELEEYAEEIEVVGGVDFEGNGRRRGEDGVKAVAVEIEDVGKDGGVTGELMVEETLNTDTNEINDEHNNREDGPHEREKKEIEPYSVPTAGAFYMHDDRFSDNAGGRHRYPNLFLRISIE